MVDKANSINIVGITDGFVPSLGTLQTTLIPASINSQIPIELNVVPSPFPIPVDGIIGKDFIKTNKCILDYLSMTFSVRFNNELIAIPITDELNQFYLVPPRCEVIRKFTVTRSNKAQIIEHKEIFPGVFVASCIIDPQNSFLKILNTNSRAVEVNKILKLKSENLENYTISNKPLPSHLRKSELLKIISKKVPAYASNEILQLCENYGDIFAMPGDKHSVNNFYEQSLQLSDNAPVYIKNYRYPHSQKEEMSRQIQDMLNKNIIEPSCSNYNSPIILVPKKGGDGKPRFRFCVDFRQLNSKLIPDKFPLPRIDDVLDNLGRARYFTTLDLNAGYWQIPLDKESKKYTNFSSPDGSFQFNVLPFGLNVAPNSFSRMMTIAFSGLDPAAAFTYMDDVIVVGTSQEHHLKNLEKVFKVCREKNLKLNPEKCNFMQREVTYLGHRCTDKGILPDNSKFKTIENYPTPSDKESVKRFVLFANYYRKFISNFASIAAPLNYLDKKNVDFNWTPQCQSAFEKLKSCLQCPPILQYPDFGKSFIITVDASKLGVGAVLSQLTDDGNSDLPIAFASKSFSKGESNKSTIEQELLAIHFGIKYFRPYVYGTKFVVRSDHKPLTYLFSLKDPTSKLARIRLELADYDFSIEHIKGSDNVAADALSRIDIKTVIKMHDENARMLAMTTRGMSKSAPKARFIIASDNMEYSNKPSISFTTKKISDAKSEIYGVLKTRHKTQTKTLFCDLAVKSKKELIMEAILTQIEQITKSRNIDTVTINPNDSIFSLFPQEEFKNLVNKYLKELSVVLTQPISNVEIVGERQRLIKHFHTHPLDGGHCGRKRTYFKMKSDYKWKGMYKDISDYIKSCRECQINKPRRSNVEEMIVTDTPLGPFESIIVDTIGPFPSTVNQVKYAITIICDFSKYLIIIPIPNKEATTVAKVLLEHCFLIFGPVKKIRTDMGTEFANSLIKCLCDLLDVEHNTSTAYHHESLGTVERSHKTLNEYLRTYTATNPKEWHRFVKYFAYCFNTTPNTAIDMMTPFELVYGKKPNKIITEKTYKEIEHNNRSYFEYINKLKETLEIAHRRAHQFICENKQMYKHIFDRKANPIALNVGEEVMLINEVRSKFDPYYKPEYKVTKLLGVNVEIVNTVNNKYQIVHKNRLRKL